MPTDHEFKVSHNVPQSPHLGRKGKTVTRITLSSISSREARHLLHGSDKDSRKDTQQRHHAVTVTETMKIAGKKYQVVTMDQIAHNAEIKRNCEVLAKDEALTMERDEFTVEDTRNSLACVEMRKMGINLNVFMGGEA